MAGFRTHITTSTLLGVGYGAAGYWYLEFPAPTCLLAAGMCGVAGMMPDLDSGPGRPLRESASFAAAVVPMMLIDRWEHFGWSVESMVLAGALLYLLIRFGLAELLRRYTVHRGMFHSIPAALIAGQVAWLVCSCASLEQRYYKAAAVVLGYLSHLLLDELYSIEWYRGRLRLKRSFGTAVKIWGDRLWANISTYGKLVILTYLMVRDPHWMNHFSPHDLRYDDHRSIIAEEPTAAGANPHLAEEPRVLPWH